MKRIIHYFPVFEWGKHYSKQTLSNDLIAAVIVTIMLIPQSLAYALLAGLPPEAGLYASIAPIILYALFGSSSALAVGPVAVVSLLTASSIAGVAEVGTAGYAIAALTLAFLSGVILLAMGLLRLGFLANFLSHPVIAGFITASGLLIATSQLKHILGVDASGHTLPAILNDLVSHVAQVNLITLCIGVASVFFLFWARVHLKKCLQALSLRPLLTDILTKAGPVFAVVSTTLLVWVFDLEQYEVSVVGEVPQSLPPFTMPNLSTELINALWVPAILISVVGFVESVSIAQTLAAKKRQKINPNQELIGLGAANLGAAFSGGYPVTGGFARSVVNFDAGAETPAAGIFTAIGLAIAALALTPLIYYLPTATLAATIIVAVLSLVDLSILKRTWAYSRSDFTAVLSTIVLTLGFGVEVGISAGVFLSIALHLYKTSQPHVAELGLVPGTQHFRNILRHKVEVNPNLLILRIDESLYFVNARFLEELIQNRVVANEKTQHILINCAAINEIDFSALESLEEINRRLRDLDIGLHLCEVKGPVMDKLDHHRFLEELNGNVYLSNYQAWESLNLKK